MYIFADGVQYDVLQEHPRLRGLHVRDEYASRSAGCLRGPVHWLCECEDASPLVEGGYDFEEFWKGTGLVFAFLEEMADSACAFILVL